MVKTQVNDEQAATARFLGNPNLWPCWPGLPLKNRGVRVGGLPACGTLFEDEDYRNGKLVSYDVGIFSIRDTPLPWKVLGTYFNVAALLSAGWVVD
jgi:hypothetical protein